MGSWLRRYQHDGQRATALVCLPHAGGTAAMFSPWHALLPADVELVGVQYPGRQDRMAEPCAENLPDVADRVAAELGELGDRSVALFGHSVGSAIAYEIAARLERDTDLTVTHLFVSGRKAPHRHHGEPDHRLADADLVAVVRRFGGDVETLDVPSLWPVILPPLRADLRMADRYRPTRVTALRTPITAFGGERDHVCAPPDLETWRDATAAGFDVEVFRGGHHYLTEDATPVVSAIVRRLRPGAAGPPRGPAVPARPPTALEQEITVLWRKSLDVREVGADDDFFELGGNSLIGMRIIDQVRESYGVELSVRAFYLARTPAGVAELIEKEKVSS
ncbi:alpha/beta fold hydrolase [Amycolatopsis sp. NPDC058986]|uniref:thioesterase II family protein n=1 Tax=unclassified Amycolatopsis TaxID=2618356 RepID=UPI00366F1E67